MPGKEQSEDLERRPFKKNQKGGGKKINEGTFVRSGKYS